MTQKREFANVRFLVDKGTLRKKWLTCFSMAQSISYRDTSVLSYFNLNHSLMSLKALRNMTLFLT